MLAGRLGDRGEVGVSPQPSYTISINTNNQTIKSSKVSRNKNCRAYIYVCHAAYGPFALVSDGIVG